MKSSQRPLKFPRPHSASSCFSWVKSDLLRIVYLFASVPSNSRCELCFVMSTLWEIMRRDTGFLNLNTKWSCWILHFQCQTICSLERSGRQVLLLRTRNSFTAQQSLHLSCEPRVCNFFPALYWPTGSSATFVTQLCTKSLNPCGVEWRPLHSLYHFFPQTSFSFLISHSSFLSCVAC